MSKKEKTALVPKLRFPEFNSSGEWKVSTLNSLAIKITNKNKDRSITRILTNSATDGVVDQSEYFEREIVTQSNIDNYFVIDEGDYVYNPRISTSAPVGPISKNKIGKGIMSPLYTVFRFNNPRNEFYEQYFKTNLWNSYLKTISNTGARHDRISISTENFMKMPLPYPSDEEQQKIADCLSSLDDLITAEDKKLSALRAHKKGLMQKLFPAEGKTLPEWRFPEFRDCGEWIECTFGDLATFLNGRAYKQDELLESGKYRVLRVGNFFSNNRWYYSDLELEDNKYCDYGDLLYAWSATFGPKIWDGEKVIYHYHIWKVVNNDDVNKKFLFMLLDYETEKLKAQSANGLGLLHITKGTIENWKCYKPCISEQKKIADCLSDLDTLITAQAEKIEALNAHKKGLMQGLFPSIEEVGE